VWFTGGENFVSKRNITKTKFISCRLSLVKVNDCKEDVKMLWLALEKLYMVTAHAASIDLT